ncbi:Lar family restriction alleviation protein [Enterobacter hormaechei]|uniref:Lar family restriction alleviation protein n=1 Tax=Enterobacter hormaechei TaxID=158836 RepID=UPI001F3DDB98|nr:Lar family restriction alleviation protein [Enterobacter hormaechei]
MAEFTKGRIIEELKASTQNASGMFEISEDTICALMSMLTYAAPQLPQPAVVDENGLLPCPFCGGAASVVDNRLGFYVKCSDDDCDAIAIGPRVPELQSEQEANSIDWEALAQSAKDKWNRRAAMLQGAELISQPYTLPDGYCVMPKKLTAENGAKGALSGEFHVTHRITCQSCGGEGCEDCNEEGGWDGEIPIGWDTIKLIYGAAVESCALPAAPQQEVKSGR